MGFFSKGAPCDVCGVTLPKKELNNFDPTWRHERKSEDARRHLCSSCLPKVLGEYFKSYKSRALAIEPTPEGGGYSFSPLNLRTRSFVWTDELKEDVRALLPAPDSICARCGEPAHFNWCSLDIFVESPFELNLKPRGEFSEQPLCGSCAARSFEEGYRRAGVVLQEVMPPGDDDGFIGPGEC